MLEIRYNKQTGEVTGLWGNRFGNEALKLKNRPDEAIMMVDSGIPDTPLNAWLLDEGTKSLIPNPAYIEPKPEVNLKDEMKSLKTELRLGGFID